mmetsp:Transcript_112879/g.319298  ORF Transcript_112879/g.319298 Transcript_112879/m.319298 type:complete len:788 (-) Transcript_112879:76-2439(-)
MAEAAAATSLLLSAETHLDEGETKEAMEEAKKVLEVTDKIKDDSLAADAMRIVIGAHRKEAERSGTKPEEGETMAEEGLERFRAAGKAREEGVMLLCLAELNGERRGSRKRTQAERWANQALAIFRRLGEKTLEAAALNQLGAINRKENDLDGAREMSNEALAVAQEAKDSRSQALSLHGLALAQALSSMHEEAIKTMEAALPLVRDLGLKKMEAAALCQLSQWNGSLGRPQEALSLAQKALALKEGNQETLANVVALSQNGQAREAVQVAKNGIETAKKSGDKREEIVALRILARAQLAQGNGQEAVSAYEEALGNIRALKDRVQEFQMLHAIAAVYMDQRMFEKAEHPLRDAVSISQCGTEKGMTLRTLAELRVDTADFEKAVEAAEQAAQAFHEESDRRGEASALLVASSAFSLSGDTDKALLKAKAAYQLFFEAGDHAREAVALQMIAELQSAQGKVTQALDTMIKVVNAFSENDNGAGAAGAMRAIADICLDANQIGEAMNMASQAQEICASIQDNAGEASSQLLLARLYNKIYEGGRDEMMLTQMRMASSQALLCAGKTPNQALQASTMFAHAQSLMVGLTDSTPPEEAVRLAKKAQTIFASLGDPSGEAHALILMSYQHMAAAEEDEVRQCLSRALSLANSCGDAAAMRAAQSGLDDFERLRLAGVVTMPAAPGGQMGAPGGGGAMGGGGAQSVAVPSANALDASTVKAKVMDLVRNAIGLDDEVEADSALMDAGMDSLSATDFTGQVAREFKLGTSPSLVFDYPTVRAIVDHLVEESAS